jgi:hypothetical protein
MNVGAIRSILYYQFSIKFRLFAPSRLCEKYFSPFTIDHSRHYSDLKLFTGFAIAAFTER